jgi:hypothetical protein
MSGPTRVTVDLGEAARQGRVVLDAVDAGELECPQPLLRRLHGAVVALERAAQRMGGQPARMAD